MAFKHDAASDTANASVAPAADGSGMGSWKQLAHEHWLRTPESKKITPDRLKKEIWDVLEQENFQFRSLLALDNLQLLELYVYPIAL